MYVMFKKQKTFSMFLSIYKNTSGSFGERPMLWEHEPQGSVSTAFSSSPKLSRVSLQALANEDTLLRIHCCRHKCFPVCPRAQHLLSSKILCPEHKNSPRKITKNDEHLIALFIIQIHILYTEQFIRHKLRHHLCVFLSSYRNTIINQSASIFSKI